MILKEETTKYEDGRIGVFEAIYDSSNVLKSTYFVGSNRLFISFNRGGVYSYSNIGKDLYDEFKNADSQGKFLSQYIKKNPDKYPCKKEFTLYPRELTELLEIKKERINENKKD